MLNIMIIDKDVHGRAAISHLLQDNFRNVNIIGELESISHSVDVMIKNTIDLVFLDEKSLLPEKSNYDFIKNTCHNPFDLVIISDKENPDLQLEEPILDYISKPLDKNKLKNSVNRVQSKKNEILNGFQNMVKELVAMNVLNKRISLCDKYEFMFPKVSDILYCKADGFYTQFFFKDGTHLMVSKNIKEYEEILPAEHFFRVHKSYLINLNEIKKYIKAEGGYIVMENGDSIPISIRKKEDFLKMIMNFQLNNHHKNNCF
jgi:two-component system, LytTR family, response regulator